MRNYGHLLKIQSVASTDWIQFSGLGLAQALLFRSWKSWCGRYASRPLMFLAQTPA